MTFDQNRRSSPHNGGTPSGFGGQPARDEHRPERSDRSDRSDHSDRGDSYGAGRGGRNGRGGRGGGGGNGGNGGHGNNGGQGGGRGDRRGVPLSELDPQLTAISHTVIGCARDVHQTLGPGYAAEVYRRALTLEMSRQSVAFTQGHAFEVRYKEDVVGQVHADLFIAERFVIAVAADAGEVSANDRAHMRSVLRAGGLELGLIINFAGRLLKDGLVRVLNPDKIAYLKAQQDEAGGDARSADTMGDAHSASDSAGGASGGEVLPRQYGTDAAAHQ